MAESIDDARVLDVCIFQKLVLDEQAKFLDRDVVEELLVPKVWHPLLPERAQSLQLIVLL